MVTTTGPSVLRHPSASDSGAATESNKALKSAAWVLLESVVAADHGPTSGPARLRREARRSRASADPSRPRLYLIILNTWGNETTPAQRDLRTDGGWMEEKERGGDDEQLSPNDPSSAIRHTRRTDCNRDAQAGFAAAHGLAHLTFTQRSIHSVFPIKADIFKVSKPDQGRSKTLGDLLVACRKKAGLTQRELALVAQIPRKWLGRWERNRAVPTQEDLDRLFRALKLPDSRESILQALL